MPRPLPPIIWIISIIMLLSVPGAWASHVQEPTAPITGIELHVYQYPRFVNQACGPLVDDGAEVFIFPNSSNVRMEAIIAADNGQDPSEHWTTRFRFDELRGRRFVNVWDTLWTHQNLGQHDIQREIAQNNAYRLDPGTYRASVVAVGDASGNVVSDECTFTVSE